MNVGHIFSEPGLVDVTYRPEIEAVNLVWHSEYDEGTKVRDAVLAAVEYVKSNGIKNWLADVSHSHAGLSDKDFAWINGQEFKEAIRGSGLTHFVLVPPLPSTGQDTSWLADWEQNTLAAFGEETSAQIISSEEKIRAFFNNA